MVCPAQQPGPFSFAQVEEAAQHHYNARFHHNRHFGAVVLADKDLALQEHPVKLLSNYGIQSYTYIYCKRQSASARLLDIVKA